MIDNDDTLDLDDLLDDEDTEGLPSDGLDEIEDEPLNDEELRQLVAELVRLREERDKDSAKAKKSKDAFEVFQAELYERIQKSPVKGSRKVDIGGDKGLVQIVPRATKFGRVLDREAAEAYFAEQAKTKEYIKEDFRMGRLHELVRECIEQKKPLPPGIDFYTKEYFTITFKD